MFDSRNIGWVCFVVRRYLDIGSGVVTNQSDLTFCKTVSSVSLTISNSSFGKTVQHILFVRPKVKMAWINAFGVIAMVANNGVFLNWTIRYLK